MKFPTGEAGGRPPRPKAPAPILEAIPAELKALKRWVAWRYEYRANARGGGKWTKVPINCRTGRGAESNNPATWTTFEEALAYYRRVKADGIGIMLGANPDGDGLHLAGVDLDKCRDPKTGSIEPWALEIIRALDSNTDISPSETGVKILLKAQLPPRPARRRTGKGHSYAMEMYSETRFFTVTGMHLDGTPTTVEDRQDELLHLHAKTFGADGKGARKPGARKVAGDDQAEGPAEPQELPEVPEAIRRQLDAISDDDLLKWASHAKNGRKFIALFEHGAVEGRDSNSEADCALLTMLAWWTGNNAARMERLFKRSPLARREKWTNRPDYRRMTIDAAIRCNGSNYPDLTRYILDGGVFRPAPKAPPERPRWDDRPVEPTPPPSAEPAEGPAPPPTEPTAIAVAMGRDLAARRVALHIAPTGSGKSFSAAQTAIGRYRRGKRTLIAVPTLRLAQETLERLEAMAPGLNDRGEVAAIFGRAAHGALDDATDDDDQDGDDEEGHYAIDEDTYIVVCTHAQIGRRGFSQFMRAIWRKLEATEGDDGKEPRPAFALIVDEVTELLRADRQEFALYHRRVRRGEPDASGGMLIPLADCPKANGSGNCGNCELVKHGGSAYFNRFGIRVLGHPSRIELDAEANHLRKPRDPLRIDPAEFDRGPDVHVNGPGGTTFAAQVLGWKGQAIDEWGRVNAPLYLFARDTDKRQPRETVGQVLGHMLRFAYRPVLTIERPVDEEGSPIRPDWLAKKIAMEDRRWAEGVTFPRLACDVPRLRFTDLASLEQIRRFAVKQGVGVIFAGATPGPDDAETLRAVFPDLVERVHPYSDRKVRQVALVTPDGYFGAGALIGADGRLVTAPLEEHGLGLVFVPRKPIAWALYKAICNDHWTARFAVENDREMALRGTLHHEAPTGTILTYARGVLGLGANLEGVRHLVCNANAFRDVSSFTPGQVAPEEFARLRAEERVALVLQNIGRALRGEKGKVCVLIVLNADEQLREILRSHPAILEGSELPPAFAAPDGRDLQQVVDQAGRWLAAGGGEWPDADPGKAKPRERAGRKPSRTREDVLAAAEAAIAAGSTWDAFQRSQQPKRHLLPEEVTALKARFQSGATK